MASNENKSEHYVFQVHKKGKPLQKSAKVIIMNVYCKLKSEHSEKTYSEMLTMTSNLTGVSTSSIKRIKSELRVKGRLSTLGQKRTLKLKKKSSRLVKYDDFTLSSIRRIVHKFYKRNEIPTAAKIMQVVNDDDDLPNVSISTIRRLLKDLGFVFRKRNRSSMLIERDDIQTWRRRYLRQIRAYRSEGRSIYYTDETWANFGHTKSAVWQDDTIKTPNQAFLAGLSTGLKAPSGKGSRIIIVHAGNEKGFVPQAEEIFKSKKDGTDYHSEMNGPHYENWFENQLLPNIDPNSVIVMDNASYHSVLNEPIPNQSTKKADIQTWLSSKCIPWTHDMLKAELLSIVDSNRDKFKSYRIDNLATRYGHTVLRLPPYHCELNPIELVWSQVKGYVASNNKTFKEHEVKKLTEEAINKVTPTYWSSCIKHVIAEESRMWELDGLIDVNVEKLEFNVDFESTETATEIESTETETADDSESNYSEIEDIK